MALGTNDPVDFTEIPTQDMPEEEQEGVKGLVLRGRRGPMLDDQGRKEAANLLITEFGGGPTPDKGLQKGTQRGWCGWREPVFLTEVDIKPDPFMVVLMEGLGNMRLVQALLETSG
jgi:hypothetical protein